MSRRHVVRNPFARHTVTAERVTARGAETCAWCGHVRQRVRGDGSIARVWLYAFRVESDGGRESVIADRLFCSRSCAESFTGTPFDEAAS